MFCSQMGLQRWCFTLFLLCSPVLLHGRPVDGLRTRRSVAHTQFMHDKGRTLQDYKRRMWLQELLDDIHTANIRELPVRTTGAGGGASSAGGPGTSSTLHPKPPGGTKNMAMSFTSSTLHPKPPGGTKNMAMTFKPEDEEGTHLPQETDKSAGHQDGGSLMKLPGKKKKKSRSGKRRDGEKKRRARSLAWLKKDLGSGLRLEWRSLLGGL